MRRPGLIGACWPAPLEEAVLRAAVLDPDRAVAAWLDLRPGLVLDDVWNPAVQRLLPLVHQNLRAAGVEDPDLPRLTGLRRRTWYENQMRLHQVRPALDALTEAEVPLLFLKGVPLALRYYGDLGLRPMADVDILVPHPEADRALDVVEGLGWRDVGGVSRAQLHRTHHGSGLRHPDGGDLDLHWHLGTPLLIPGDEEHSSDDFWAAAEALSIPQHGIEGRTLAPTDMLLHVITHGLWSGSGSTVRWIADAAVVLRDAPIDWDRLVDQAVRRRVAPLVGDALRYLGDDLEVAAVPAATLRELRQSSGSRRERRLLRALLGPQEGPAVVGGLPHLRSYWAYTRLKWGPVRSARELPRFVTGLWDLERPSQLPAGAVRRVRHRLAERRHPTAPSAATPWARVSRPTVAVVVPTHLRPEHLERCLAALRAQDEPAEQIVVVHGQGDEAAAAVLERHADLVTAVATHHQTSIARLHLGASRARAAVVAFTDDDAAPRPDWVRRLSDHFTDPAVGAVGGRDVAPGAPPPTERHVGGIRWWGRVVGGHSDGIGPARDVQHLRGVNMAVRRELLRFPVGLHGPGAPGYGELATCLAVLDAGARVRYDPDLLVDHDLAERYEHGPDRRHRPSLAARTDDAFNQTYTLLSMRRGQIRQMAYVLLVGDRSCGGALRCAAALVTGDRQLAREWWPLLQAQRAAWRAWRAQPLRTVRPDEPFPEGERA